MSKKFTYEQVKGYIESDLGNGCKLLSKEYVDIFKPLEIECKCGEKFTKSFNEFKNKNRNCCQKCSGTKILSNEIIIKELQDYITTDNILEIEKQEDKYFITLKCLECGEQDVISLRQLRRNKKCLCKKCIQKLKAKSRERSKEDIMKELQKLNVDVIDIFKVNKRWNVSFYCSECREKSERTLDQLKRNKNTKCKKCHSSYIKNLYKLNYNDVKKYISSKDYVLLDTYYENARLPLKMKCEKEHICYISFDNFKRGGCRCPICNESKGEQKIREILQNKKVSFVSQQSFYDLKGLGGDLLRFDFAIFEDENKTKLKCLIEYDGIFHYEKQYDDDGFETIQEHDKRKNEYCKNNNIRLIRIPYWDFDNIEEILNNKNI